MEEVRYSKRIRAARSSSAGEENKSLPETTRNVDRPAYHPRLGVVMTYKQQDTLKKQITVYATICQQLVELHKASVAAGGVQDLNGSCSPAAATVLKATPRHRWAPSQSQVQILERIYESGSGATPNKKKVKEITEQLSVHGSVTETNVYNWFQNRKAKVRRSKQRMKDVDSEGDGDWKDRKVKPPPVLKSSETSRSEGEEKARLIYISGDLCEVPGGVFSVVERFGEGASMVNEQGEIVPVDKRGFILQPLQSGGSYRLKENIKFSPLNGIEHNIKGV